MYSNEFNTDQLNILLQFPISRNQNILRSNSCNLYTSIIIITIIFKTVITSTQGQGLKGLAGCANFVRPDDNRYPILLGTG